MKNHECDQKEITILACECWIEEYEQLKRMKDNIKNRIAGLKSVMAFNSKTKSYSEDEIANIDDVIILLQSLDK